MALAINWAEAALIDLESAAEYIAKDSHRYATVLVREAHEAAQSLNILSKRGRIIPEFNDRNIRELFVCNYRLIYLLTPHTAYVIGFIHGSSDLWNAWDRKRTT